MNFSAGHSANLAEGSKTILVRGNWRQQSRARNPPKGVLKGDHAGDHVGDHAGDHAGDHGGPRGTTGDHRSSSHAQILARLGNLVL